MSDCYIGLDQQYTLQLLPRQPSNQPASGGAVGCSSWGAQPAIAAPSAPGVSGGKEGGGVQDSTESRRARRAAMAAERAAERQRDAQQQQQQQQPEGGSKGWGAGSAVALGAAREGEQLTEVEWDDEPSCA
eukprot:1151432-Pelagomonas_calceolata.AAC.6